MTIYEKLRSFNSERRSKIFWEFCGEVDTQVRVIYFLVTLAQQQDKSRLIARFALSSVDEKPDPIKSKYKTMAEIRNEVLTEGPATEAFKKLQEDLYRNMYVRSLECFESFLSELLAITYQKKPEMLRSKETITLDELLQFEDRGELIKYVSEMRIMKLQMQGLKVLNRYIDERHGLKWFESEDVLFLDKVMATRNLIVHNRSRANFHYRSIYPDSDAKVGEKIVVSSYADDDICRVLAIAGKIDEITVGKFELDAMTSEEYLRSELHTQ